MLLRLKDNELIIIKIYSNSFYFHKNCPVSIIHLLIPPRLNVLRGKKTLENSSNYHMNWNSQVVASSLPRLFNFQRQTIRNPVRRTQQSSILSRVWPCTEGQHNKRQWKLIWPTVSPLRIISFRFDRVVVDKRSLPIISFDSPFTLTIFTSSTSL